MGEPARLQLYSHRASLAAGFPFGMSRTPFRPPLFHWTPRPPTGPETGFSPQEPSGKASKSGPINPEVAPASRPRRLLFGVLSHRFEWERVCLKRLELGRSADSHLGPWGASSRRERPSLGLAATCTPRVHWGRCVAFAQARAQVVQRRVGCSAVP